MQKSIEASNKQNEMIEETKNQITIVEEKNDLQNELMERIASEVDDILNANAQIMDSISNLSATSEEVAASSENCTVMVNDSMDSMNELNILLEEVAAISERLREVAQ